MSEDGFADAYDEPGVDLIIETLTGSTFDVRVYPTDTILDIKKKIQRVEGIPVHHQNLLYRMEEMKDCKRLCDVGIVDGSTLKLVLAMRGGPISTRRLSACDHQLIWKDLKEFIEHTREEFGDKLTAGAKVSVLVFKDGEVINLIRVIENEDGSYYPYGGGEKPTKMVLRDDGQLEFYNRLQENHVMLEKLAELRKRMADMSLRRQLRNSKPVEFSNEESTSAGYVGQKPNSAPCSLANDLQDFEHKCSVKILNQFRRDAESLLKLHASQFGDDDDEEDTEDAEEEELAIDEVEEELMLPPLQHEDSIALKEKHRGKNSFYNILFQEPPPPITATTTTSHSAERRRTKAATSLLAPRRLQRRSGEPYLDPDANLPILTRKKSATIKKQSSPTLSLWGAHRSTSSDSNLSSPTAAATLADTIGLLDEATDTEEKDVLSPMRGHCSGTVTMSKVQPRNSVRLTPLLLQNSPERAKTTPESVELAEDSQGICDIAASKLGLLKRWQSMDCSSGSASASEEVRARSATATTTATATTSSAAAAVTARRRRAGAGSPNNALGDMEILDRNYYLPPIFPTDGTGHGEAGPASMPAHFTAKNDRVSDLFFGGDDRIMRSPLYQRFSQTDAATTTAKSRSKWTTSSGTPIIKPKPIESLTYAGAERELPPLRIPDRLAKDIDEIKQLCRPAIGKIQVDRTRLETLPEVMVKKRVRCAQCNRRLNITTMHDCRCGGVFCAQHRYSEVHGCKYDYKSEGRRLLQRQNPLVVAEKLNKL